MNSKELTNNQKMWIDNQVLNINNSLLDIKAPGEQYRKGHELGNVLLDKCKRQLSAYEYAKGLIIALLESIELKNRG